MFDSILEFFSGIFFDIFDYIIDFIFIDCKSLITSAGDRVLSFFYSTFGSTNPSLSFIVFFSGFLFLLFVIKLVISLVR